MGVLFSTRLINELILRCLLSVSADQSSNAKLSAVIGIKKIGFIRSYSWIKSFFLLSIKFIIIALNRKY